MTAIDEACHWPLRGSLDEVTGRGRAAVGVGAVGLDHDGARFPAASRLHIDLPTDRRAFTWSVWAEIPAAPRGPLGSVLSCFDVDRRHGAELGLVHGTSTTSQTNIATVEFGVDWGATPRLTDLGRPGHSVGVFGLAVHDGRLHAASLGADGRGQVHVWGDGWQELPGAGTANSVTALASHRGQLYAGTTRYRTGGSALDLPENDEPGGEILRWDNGGWTSCGRLPNVDAIATLIVHGGELYAAATYQEGVWRWDDPDWVACGSPGRRVLTLGSHRGHLMAGGNDHLDPDRAIELTRQGIVTPQRAEEGGGGVFTLLPDGTWRCDGFQHDTTQVYSLATADDRLFASTWPNGLVFERTEDGAWRSTGRLGEETEVMGLMTYNGSLYGGTLPHAELHRRDPSGWTRVARVDVTPNARYRRAAGLAIHDGALVVGTLPSGRVHAMRVGDVVTRDTSLAGGWHHLCVTCDGEELVLYVDGERFRAPRSTDALEQLLPERRLTVGNGTRGHFAGALRDLRVWPRSLSEPEIRALPTDGPRTTKSGGMTA